MENEPLEVEKKDDVIEEDNYESTEVKPSKMKVFINMSVCLLVVSVLIFFITYVHFKRVETGLRKEYQQLKVSSEDASKQLSDTLNKLHIAVSDSEKFKKQLSEIKDNDDLLKRDIELYIKTTHPKVPRVVAKSIAENIVDLSKDNNISPELVLGIIKIESSFNPMAVGPKTKYGHARGLMQVMPEWVKKLDKINSKYDFHEVDLGIDSGIKVFLIHLEEGNGDISTGLYKYVNKDREYVKKVYAAVGKFVAFRSTIGSNDLNVTTDIETNGDSSGGSKEGEKEANAKQ